MAIREIKTEKFFILGKEWRGTIKFESKKDYFFMSLPKLMTDILKYPQVSGKTIEELRDEFEKKVNEYGEIVKTTRRVLVFTTDATVKRQEGAPGTTREGESGVYGSKKELFSGRLSISFARAIESTRGGRKEYRDLVGNMTDQDLIRWGGEAKYGVHVVDWTQEREDFFRAMLDQIEKAKARMDSIFEGDSAKIVAMIDRVGSGLALGFDGGKGGS